ncbi:MAG: hypothetical protein U0572_02755 [Phycisphaerales bacterium]
MTFALPTSRAIRRLTAAATIALACLGPVSVAAAQFGGRAGFDDAFRPDFLARDITLFVETLELEDWQRPIVENLLDDYKVSFDSGVEEVRTRMNSMKDTVSKVSADEVLKQIMAPIDEWSKRKLQLRAEFLDNVKSQLSEQQAERWVKLERALRREKTLDQGEIQGESVNLVLLIKELQLSPEALQEMQPSVDEFEARLDEALANRSRRIDSQKSKVADAMQSNDSKAGVAAMESIMEARVAVRSVQDAGRDALTDALRKAAGEKPATDFERLALERGYPKVYRIDPIIPLFATAKGIEDLTDDQKSSLDALEAQYMTEQPVENKKLADVYRQEEPREPRRRVDQMAARLAGDAGAHQARSTESEALAAARKEREDFYDRYRKAIMDILNLDQKRRMPTFGKGGVRLSPEERDEIAKEKAESGHGRTASPARMPIGTTPPRNNGEKKGKEGSGRMPSSGGGATQSPTDRPSGSKAE